jgi:hypothetical protein
MCAARPSFPISSCTGNPESTSRARRMMSAPAAALCFLDWLGACWSWGLYLTAQLPELCQYLLSLRLSRLFCLAGRRGLLNRNPCWMSSGQIDVKKRSNLSYPALIDPTPLRAQASPLRHPEIRTRKFPSQTQEASSMSIQVRSIGANPTIQAF